MSERSKPLLLWPSSARIQYADVPAWVEVSLRDRFPQVDVEVVRDPEIVSRRMEDCEILVSWTLPPEQFARCRKLRWIHSPAAGVRQLWVPGLAESDVIVTNAKTVHAIPVAEHAVALLLALARRLPDSFRYQAERRWGQAESWQPGSIPTEVNEKTLGLLGLGAIGKEIAVRARSLGMRVLAVKRDPSEGAEFADRLWPPEQLSEMLSEADFLVLAAPDTPETRQRIGARELACLRSTAYVINIARGVLIDTNALADALESNAISGAALDVTHPEPLPPEHRLWTAPNLLITPHLAGATDRYWQRQADLFMENLRRYLAGETLLNLVDKKRGY